MQRENGKIDFQQGKTKARGKRLNVIYILFYSFFLHSLFKLTQNMSTFGKWQFLWAGAEARACGDGIFSDYLNYHIFFSEFIFHSENILPLNDHKLILIYNYHLKVEFEFSFCFERNHGTIWNFIFHQPSNQLIRREQFGKCIMRCCDMPQLCGMMKFLHLV